MLKKIIVILRELKYKFVNPKVKTIHNYWKDPLDFGNSAEGHLLFPEHSKCMFEQIQKLKGINENSSIMEIGCNCGKNLNYLYERRYQNLSGIEISPKAVALMRKEFPNLYYNSSIFVNSLEGELKYIKSCSVDVIFSLAVLMHIHTNSEFIFKELVRITKKYIITLEDEKCSPAWSHYPRNYKRVFEGLGMKQIKEVNVGNVKGLVGHTLRVFRKEKKQQN